MAIPNSKCNIFNPLIHKRQSRRLNGYNYAKEGLYFVTIKTRNNRKLFGEINNGIMKLNDSGFVAENCWLAIPEHFLHTTLHDFVIMLDHIHGIIEIVYNPKSPSKTIGSIIRGFKTGVTKQMKQHTEIHKIWQRNCHDHIIRNTESYKCVCQYIKDNPKKWNNDNSEHLIQ